MLAISVNDGPGWSVTIAPSGIGVPVAFTPGFGPHADVSTEPPDAAVLVVLDEAAAVAVLVERLLLLPQLVSTISPTAAVKATPNRRPIRSLDILTCLSSS